MNRDSCRLAADQRPRHSFAYPQGAPRSMRPRHTAHPVHKKGPLISQRALLKKQN